jgi:hypothetical protein
MKVIYSYITTTNGKCYALSYNTDNSTHAIVEEVDPITKIPVKNYK